VGVYPDVDVLLLNDYVKKGKLCLQDGTVMMELKRLWATGFDTSFSFNLAICHAL